jgi:hypothetical protein
MGDHDCIWAKQTGDHFRDTHKQGKGAKLDQALKEYLDGSMGSEG